VVDWEGKLNATLEIADDRARRRAQYQIRDWLTQDRPAALQWIGAHTRNEDDRKFFESMIRQAPLKPEPGPNIILE
jgi:hypothetical protein